MNARHRALTLVFAVPGILVCVGAVVAFVLRMWGNGLPEGVGTSVRDSYLAVGDAFSRGFAAGFFLCFFLMLVALVVGTWFEHRKHRSATGGRTFEALSRGR